MQNLKKRRKFKKFFLKRKGNLIIEISEHFGNSVLESCKISSSTFSNCCYILVCGENMKSKRILLLIKLNSISGPT